MDHDEEMDNDFSGEGNLSNFERPDHVIKNKIIILKQTKIKHLKFVF